MHAVVAGAPDSEPELPPRFELVVEPALHGPKANTARAETTLIMPEDRSTRALAGSRSYTVSEVSRLQVRTILWECLAGAALLGACTAACGGASQGTVPGADAGEGNEAGGDATSGERDGPGDSSRAGPDAPEARDAPAVLDGRPPEDATVPDALAGNDGAAAVDGATDGSTPCDLGGDAAALGRGAQEGPTASPPTGSPVVRVHVGDSIQSALNQLAAAGGGWAVLDPGTFPLLAPLVLPSAVTLAGSGRSSVLSFAAGAVGNPAGSAFAGLVAVQNTDDALHDVALRDFRIDCGATAQELADPKAPPIYGVVLVSSGAAANVLIEHMSVSSCTVHGVHVKGVSKLTIAESSFTGNGGAAGAEYFHNLYIRRIVGGLVRNNILSDSPFGDGLNASYDSQVTVTCNEASRNGFRGLRTAETNDISFLDNVTNANKASGLVVNSELNGCKNVLIEGNTSDDNGQYGIQMVKISGTLTLRNNTTVGNAAGNVTGP